MTLNIQYQINQFIFFLQEILHDLTTKINKLKEVLNRYIIYEEIEEFRVLIHRLRFIIGQLENLEIENKNKVLPQVH